MVVTRGNLEPTSENAMTDQADHVAGGSDDGNDGNNKSSQTATPTPTTDISDEIKTPMIVCQFTVFIFKRVFLAHFRGYFN